MNILPPMTSSISRMLPIPNQSNPTVFHINKTNPNLTEPRTTQPMANMPCHNGTHVAKGPVGNMSPVGTFDPRYGFGIKKIRIAI